MKTPRSAVMMIFAVALGFGANAAETTGTNDGNRPVRLSAPAVVLGVKVQPGAYTLRWSRERGSEQVRIEIAQGSKVLAAGKGVWVASTQPSPYEALVYRPEHGADTLAEIRFRNSAEMIRIQPDTPVTTAEGNDTSGRTLVK